MIYRRFDLLILAMGLALAGCQQRDTSSGQEEKSQVAVAKVEVCHPEVRPMEETITINAVATYTRKENVRATTSGYIERMLIQQGQSVKAGQLAVELMTKEAAALGESMLADSSIGVSGVLPVHIRSGGVVTQVFFQAGDYVMEGDQLADLVSPSSLAIKLFVAFDHIGTLRRTSQIQVSLPDGEAIWCRVGGMLPTEDVNSQSTPFLLYPLSPRLLPENLNVTAKLVTAQEDAALVVPRQALQSNEEQTRFWVMEVTGDSIAVQRPVDPGIRDESYVQILHSGLSSESSVVCRGAYALPDSTPIRALPFSQTQQSQ